MKNIISITLGSIVTVACANTQLAYDSDVMKSVG